MYGVDTLGCHSGAGWDFFPQRVLDRRGFHPSHTSAVSSHSTSDFYGFGFLTIEKPKPTVKYLAVPKFLSCMPEIGDILSV